MTADHRDRRFQGKPWNRSRSFGIAGHVGVEYAEAKRSAERRPARRHQGCAGLCPGENQDGAEAKPEAAWLEGDAIACYVQ